MLHLLSPLFLRLSSPVAAATTTCQAHLFSGMASPNLADCNSIIAVIPQLRPLPSRLRHGSCAVAVLVTNRVGGVIHSPQELWRQVWAHVMWDLQGIVVQCVENDQVGRSLSQVRLQSGHVVRVQLMVMATNLDDLGGGIGLAKGWQLIDV